MKCKEFRQFIQSYLDRELSKEEEKRWHEHLKECHACSSDVKIYEKCIAMLQRFVGEELPPKTLRQRLEQRLGCDCFDFCFPGNREINNGDRK